jgi:hypothetical protein
MLVALHVEGADFKHLGDESCSWTALHLDNYIEALAGVPFDGLSLPKTISRSDEDRFHANAAFGQVGSKCC